MKQTCYCWLVSHIDSFYCFGLFLGKQKFNSPSRNTSPIQVQGSSAYYNQHIPQYAFPYPLYRYTIETYVKSNKHYVEHFRLKA